MSRWTLAVLLVVTMMLVSCGPAAQPTPSTQAQAPEPFMLALPRIVVNIDNAGTPSLLGLTPAMFGMDAKAPQNLVDMAISSGIQHIEVRTLGRGLALYVNGKPLPHIGWDDPALEQAADLAQVFTGQDMSALKQLLPVVRRLGLDIVVRFPNKAGAADIPFISLEEGAQAVPKPSEGPSTAVIKLDAKIDEKGFPSIFDLTAGDLATLGLSLSPVLDADTLARLQAANIQHLLIRTRPGGLFIYVNGKALPHLVWDQRFIANAAEVYMMVAPGNPYQMLIDTVAPGVDRADIDVFVALPKAAGAADVPLPER
jgi:hypothetical protein